MESVNAPATPPSVTAVKVTGQLAKAAAAETNSAPPIAATDPAKVTPPEVPAGTRFPDTIDTASVPTRVPISVAQVSAAHAARPPAASAYQIDEGARIKPNAAPANTPPFAST